MTEKIGKITLDYKHYPGEDFYCDGEVEDELLDIVRNYLPAEFGRIIEERAKWPILYHLSPLRENIVDWIPMEKDAKVLEIGSGCGAVTGRLAEKAGSVTSIDLSKKRSLINAYRHQECDNVTIHVGNFKDIEPDLPDDFDYICFIGVFEYGRSYIDTKNPYVDWLRLMQRHLKENGRIIIAIENKLGLKYFAGCKEDHLGTYFSGIEDYAQGGGVRTFVKSRLEEMFEESGLTEYSFYYPYPDYKFMTAIYSDARLPKPGELYDNRRNFDRDRMLLFDEKQAFDGIIKDGLFPVFSNSYAAVIGKGFEVKYAKYSNDRAGEYAIRTQICEDEAGKRTVRKSAMTEMAAEHVQSMETAYKDLKRRFEGSRLQVNNCRLYEEQASGNQISSGGVSAEFEYINGITLEEVLDYCLDLDDIESFHILFDEYMERISYNEEMPAADYDLIFANILIETDRYDVETIKNLDWTIIDYEWTFGKAMAAKEIAFRAIYCYVLENEKRNKLNLDRIIEKLGITEAEAEDFRQQEMDFQKFVTGKHKSMAELRDTIGYKIMEPLKWVHKFDDSSEKERIQVYEDRGEGYKEEESYFVKDAYEGENLVSLTLSLDGNVTMLRIDPAFDCCVVKFHRLIFNGEAVETGRKNIITNGKMLRGGSYVFATEDPNINIKISNLNRKAENTLEAELEIVRIPLSLARDMAGAVKKIF